MKRSFGVLVVALVASVVMAGVALADGVDEPAAVTTLESVLVDVVEEDVDGETVTTIYVALMDNEGEPTDCFPDPDAEPVPETPAVDGEGDGDGEELIEPADVLHMPGDCISFEVDHPSGKVHHGAIVSTAANYFHPSTLDGVKKGEIMRCMAKHGKTNGGDCAPPVDGDGDGDDVEPAAAEADKPAKGNSENAKNKDKPNKGKKNR